MDFNESLSGKLSNQTPLNTLIYAALANSNTFQNEGLDLFHRNLDCWKKEKFGLKQQFILFWSEYTTAFRCAPIGNYFIMQNVDIDYV